MKRLLLLCLLLAGCAAAPSLEPADSLEQARAVEAVERVTGQRFAHAVPVYHFSPGTIRAATLDVADDSVIGFYDTDRKQLYLSRASIGTDWHFGLRIHETTHALQDQLYDLSALDAATQSIDAYYALQALIEGHAECVMVDVAGAAADTLVYGESGSQHDMKLTRTDMLHAFEYTVGLKFVQALKARGGYGAVDAAFRLPPASTEQVIHPAKYPAELPDVIELDVAALRRALPGWELAEPECLGELGVLTTLIVDGGVGTAGTAAAGWGGDASIVVSRGGASVAIQVTSWDTQHDALEYLAAISSMPATQSMLDPSRPRVVISVHGLDVRLAQVLRPLLATRVNFHAEP